MTTWTEKRALAVRVPFLSHHSCTAQDSRRFRLHQVALSPGLSRRLLDRPSLSVAGETTVLY